MDKFLKKRPIEAEDDTTEAAKQRKISKADAGSSESTDAITQAPELEMLQHLSPTSPWCSVLMKEFRKPYMRELDRKVTADRAKFQVFPEPKDVFACLNFTPPEEVRVVILGQDPYHGPGQAHGFCFSVNRGIPVPPSLKNIYAELEDDFPGFVRPSHGASEA